MYSPPCLTSVASSSSCSLDSQERDGWLFGPCCLVRIAALLVVAGQWCVHEACSLSVPYPLTMVNWTELWLRISIRKRGSFLRHARVTLTHIWRHVFASEDMPPSEISAAIERVACKALGSELHESTPHTIRQAACPGDTAPSSKTAFKAPADSQRQLKHCPQALPFAVVSLSPARQVLC